MSAKFALPLSVQLGSSYWCLAFVLGISLLSAGILLLCDGAYWLWIAWACLTILEGFHALRGRGWTSLIVDAEENATVERADGGRRTVRLIDCYKVGHWLLIRVRPDAGEGALMAWLSPLRFLVSSKDQNSQFHRLRLYHRFRQSG